MTLIDKFRKALEEAIKHAPTSDVEAQLQRLLGGATTQDSGGNSPPPPPPPKPGF